VHWPADHPAITDPALSPWAGEVDSLCPEAEVVRLLRHLPGRRATTMVRSEAGPAVLKLFATSRARGGHRRLAAFGETAAADLVPRALGHRKGHLALVEFVPGTPLVDLVGDEPVRSCAVAGLALRRLHASGADLGRTWGPDDEIDQLRRTAGPVTRHGVEQAARWARPGARAVVPSHRDCHPAQVIRTASGVRFIDLDDCAMAPPALDVGNFVAHLQMEGHLGRWSREVAGAAAAAFMEGYGSEPDGLAWWNLVSLARLAALAETRHGWPSRARGLLELLAETRAGATARTGPA